MANDLLQQAVYTFVGVVRHLADEDLEREWSWGDYNEGVRFAFFRTYEELKTLAAELLSERAQSGHPVTTAHRALASYQLAFRDLQAVLLGIDHKTANASPGEGEWSIYEAVAHIVEAERAFFTVISYGLDRFRTAQDLPVKMSEEHWDDFWRGDRFPSIRTDGPLSEILTYYNTLHNRILNAFAEISDEEIQSTVAFWESELMPIRFRLFRFDSHLRQHTVQVEKTLAALGCVPTEAQRLLRLIYQALAEVEGGTLGAPNIELEPMESAAERITNWTDDIASLFA